MAVIHTSYYILVKEHMATETETAPQNEDRSYTYLYTDGNLQRIINASRGFENLGLYGAAASVGICQGFRIPGIPAPSSAPTAPRVFKILEGDFQEPSSDPRCRWDILKFDSGDTGVRYNLDHANGERNICGDIQVNPWLWLFSGTEQFENTSDRTPRSLSGKLTIFWGLIALNFGCDRLDNIQFTVQNDQLRIRGNWPALGQQPNREPDRYVVIKIYRHPEGVRQLSDVENTWRLE